MKPASLALALSLAVNAALAALLLQRPTLVPPAVREFFGGASAPAPTPFPPRVSPPPPAPAALWTRLHAEDLRAWVAQLRAAGFPPDAVRALVMAEIDRRYGSRQRELEDPDPATPFWRLPSYSGSITTPQRVGEITALQREVRTLLRDLLRDDFFSAEDDASAAERRRHHGDLPRAKVEAIEAIEGDYSDMERMLHSVARDIRLPEDQKAYALLEAEKRADLAAVLTPEELEQHELRNSDLAHNLRARLVAFEATEQEYRTIFRLEQAVADTLQPRFGIWDAEGNARREEAEKKLAAQIKEALGDERYAVYARATHQEYRQLNALAQRENLPATSINQAFAMRDTVALESSRILDDVSLDAARKREALKALAQNTRSQVTALLGANVGANYNRIIENWLRGVEGGAAVVFSGNGYTFRRPDPPPAAPR